MINKEWNKADLRIYSKELTSLEISQILSQTPSESKEKGQLMSPKNSNSQKFEKNIWILRSELPKNLDIEKHLLKLCMFVDRKKSELKVLKEKCDIDIFCGLSLKGYQASFTLSTEVIEKLSSFPIDIIFDLYVEEQ